jgi:phage terminase small subunit
MALTAKQRRFVAEYLVDLNGKQAAIRAGYTVRRAEVTASELLANRKVSEEVALAMQARQQRTEITQDRVLKELGRIAFFDIRRLYKADGSLKAAHELDEDTAAALSSVEVFEEIGPAEADVELEAQPHGGELKRQQGRRALLGYTKKVKVFDKNSSLTLAMRHLGMLKDRTEHTGPNGGPIQAVTMSPAEFQQIAKSIANEV